MQKKEKKFHVFAMNAWKLWLYCSVRPIFFTAHKWKSLKVKETDINCSEEQTIMSDHESGSLLQKEK